MSGSRDIGSDLQSIIQYSDAVTRIGEIDKKNFQTYHQNVWSKEKKAGKSGCIDKL